MVSSDPIDPANRQVMGISLFSPPFPTAPGPVGTPWTLASAVYSGNTFATTGEATDVFGGHFKPDGTKMYVVDLDAGDVSNSVYEYNLGTAWDVTTAVYSGNSFSFTLQDISPSGIFFKTDGTKMFMCGGQTDAVYEYNLVVAWDVSTAVYSTNNFPLSSFDTSIQDIYMSPDGLHAYFGGAAGDLIIQIDMSSAWDLSTASFVTTFTTTPETGLPFGVFFKDDGTKLFVADNQTVFEYDVSTPWDVSTSVFSSISLDLSAELTDNRGIYIKPDGFHLFAFGTTAVFDYNLSP